MVGIIRAQTPIEKDMTPDTDGDSTGFIPIMGPDNKPTAKNVFIRQAKEQEKIAGKKGLPFAMQVALEEFDEYFETQAKISMRKNGYVKADEIKPLKVEWEKYSDLKNFKIVKEDEVPDDNLSNKNPGLNVTAKKIEYRFKGFEKYLYRVMETKENSILRARANRKKLTNELRNEDAGIESDA